MTVMAIMVTMTAMMMAMGMVTTTEPSSNGIVVDMMFLMTARMVLTLMTMATMVGMWVVIMAMVMAMTMMAMIVFGSPRSLMGG